MVQLLVWFLLVVSLLGAMPVAGFAQSALSIATGGGSTSDDGSASDLANAIREAAELGVSVIVVDAQGNLVGTGAAEGADEAEVEDPMASASPLMKTQSEVQAFDRRFDERLETLPNSIAEVAFILRATSPDGRVMTYVETLGFLVLFLLVARVFIRRVYGPHIAAKFVIPLIQDAPDGYREKMPFLVFRFFAGVVGTLICIIIAFILSMIFLPHLDNSSIQFTVTAILTAFAAARTASNLWRMILSPYLDQYRIPSFTARDAKRLYFWASALASYNIVAILFSTWIKDFGLNYNVYALLYGFLTLVGIVGNILMILVNGKAISNAIRDDRAPGEVSWLLRILSYAWVPVLITYFIFSWLELSLDLVLENPTSIPPIAGVYTAFLSIIVVYGIINYLIESYFTHHRDVRRLNEKLAKAEAQEAAGGGEDAAGFDQAYSILTYEELARRVAGIVAFVAGTLALIVIWDTEEVLVENQLFNSLVDVVVILFIGYIIYHLFRIWIDSKIAEEVSDQVESEPGDEGGVGSASRLATLLPLFRGTILAVVVVSIALLALIELGVNVSPLFAGAGVVGLAVGFGAQTLVRDIFSGAFFLIDDAFRKGEYIDIGNVKGMVEKISVRSFQLRHHLGALHTIPFGEIQVLTNYSRDWVIMKLPLRVTYDTDVEKVRKLIKNLGKELLNDPVIGDNFIQPLKSQGVIEMQDSAMIIRVKFMTKPGDQWLVRKKVYEDIRQLFEKEGIKFAHREVTVRLADEHAEELTPRQREAVTGAVQATIYEDMMDVNEPN